MSKRKRGVSSAAARKQAMALVSGVKRQEPSLAQPLAGKGRKARRGVVVYLHPLAKDVLKHIAALDRKPALPGQFAHLARRFIEGVPPRPPRSP